MNGLECGNARRLAWGKGDPIVTSVERGRALGHVGQCVECRRFAADMERMSLAMAQGAPAPAVPGDVAQRLRRRVAVERTALARPRRRPVLLALAIAAVAVMVVLSGVRLLRPSDMLADIIHRQAELLAEPGIESSDAAVVQRWLAARTALAVHVPTFSDARLTGATATTVRGRTAAVIRFQVGNQFMTYTLAADERRELVDAVFRRGSSGTLTTVAWRSAGLQHFWVGAVPAQHLASFAKRCAEQARMAVGVTTLAPEATPIA